MAFEDRDTSTPKTVTEAVSVEEVTFRRIRAPDFSGTVPLAIIVTRLVDVDGERHRMSTRVPQATVDAGWPGGSKTLKAHLLAAIDAAV